MKKIFNVIVIGLCLVSCGETPHADSEVHYINMNCVIVEKIPIVPKGRHGSKAFLIRSVKDTNMYCEYIDLNYNYMPDSIYYNHEVGDTLHFDYICKSRFFYK